MSSQKPEVFRNTPANTSVHYLKTSSSQSACYDNQGTEGTETSSYNCGWLTNPGFLFHGGHVALTVSHFGWQHQAKSKQFKQKVCVFVLISLAPFLGDIRKPRGCDWHFPSHTMLYHFHSSTYHWTEMEKGHFVCIFSTSHHRCYYWSLTWMLSQISTLKLTSSRNIKTV